MFATSFPCSPDSGTFHFDALTDAIAKGEKSGMSWSVGEVVSPALTVLMAYGDGLGRTTFTEAFTVRAAVTIMGESLESEGEAAPMRDEDYDAAPAPAHNLPAECPCAPCRASEAYADRRLLGSR